ncbi:class I SAM-dependent methyltransferase [Leptospira biflexa]|uniref:class I SAM-dependent methyltransferase n=1 Tax=Leptospira biflexa TaxID=172 RepID=UPI001084811C|nr:class I SAM-dependent methyltransferase [Leptospira biflexa]TGM38242.1 class I SAM-dependent methyltransferase [Leptospira biflexa]TGM41574.1 class I SAM-dependent methyltransferase [Leptospira biflexa]TGM47774.1 class I SAM-dependent methyltransferase [Leptospira biflexa]TGM49760.1 class I SAM-dependent methyltransferase [Leptospira biflexa]TGM55021.1 class I SAM-dependent methyltransferase [Leptospira biflexa]
MTPFPFSKSPVTELSQVPPYYVSNFGHWSGVTEYQEAGIQFLIEFAKHCRLRKNASILEVGSGLGGSILYWSHHFSPKQISAINLVGEQSNFAKQLFIENQVLVDPFLEGSWETMKILPPNQYDFVFSVDAAYHFENTKEFYRESFRVLQPGGKLVFNLFQSKQKIKSPFRSILKLFFIPKDQVKMVEDTMNDLEDIGFVIEKNQNWTNPVIDGFIQNSKKMQFSLQTFGSLLRIITRSLGLQYHYYVVIKPNSVSL